jgi:hypothetical protein
LHRRKGVGDLRQMTLEKTTLVRELAKAGALYYSQKCPVPDGEGLGPVPETHVGLDNARGRSYGAAQARFCQCGRGEIGRGVNVLTECMEATGFAPERL